MADHLSPDSRSPDLRSHDSAPPDAGTRSHDRRVAWSVVALTAVTVLIGALAAAPVHHPVSHPVVANPSQDATCAEWGDGCRVCQRAEDGIACSLPGIACTPKAEQSCLRRVGG
ncbi:hypothetical protein [Methylobacterium sp. Leaf117]|uniref:hypothetical protein n=1 Tax=Methylobacterium sp. Leaf117 TaxID=1736260 RepID=UPI0006F6B5CE|nr:hypothetical protein [Methylobacterium sp. Leaf117]KQP79181.1 hypothetical protein ASF57_18395 [Methylobacterium sp. Leaf117]